MDQKQALTIKTKKLGVLLRDARLAAGKSMKDSGEVIGVSGATISSFERGKKAPSLPELELLAYFLEMPLSHFWGDEAKSETPGPSEKIDIEHMLALRDRYIGAALRSIRTDAGMTMKALAEEAGITTGRLRKYETGESSIPVPELETLAAALGKSVGEFTNDEGPVGRWLVDQREIQDFLALPIELREFVIKPLNEPYLTLARKMSEMPAEKLREVAENLLEISL